MSFLTNHDLTAPAAHAHGVRLLNDTRRAVELTDKERRFLNKCLRRYDGWSYRNHSLVGWVGTALFMLGLALTVFFARENYQESLLSGGEPRPVSWIVQSPLLVGFVLMIHSLLGMAMRIIGKLHRELESDRALRGGGQSNPPLHATATSGPSEVDDPPRSGGRA